MQLKFMPSCKSVFVFTIIIIIVIIIGIFKKRPMYSASLKKN